MCDGPKLQLHLAATLLPPEMCTVSTGTSLAKNTFSKKGKGTKIRSQKLALRLPQSLQSYFELAAGTTVRTSDLWPVGRVNASVQLSSRPVVPQAHTVVLQAHTVVLQAHTVVSQAPTVVPLARTVVLQARTVVPQAHTVVPLARTVVPQASTVVPLTRTVVPQALSLIHI